MYAAIRQVKAKPGMEDALRERLKGAVAVVSNVPGFMNYYVVYSPDDTLTAISIFNTVAEAYRQLAAEGWLALRHGRGAKVIERAAPTAKKSDIVDYRQRLRELVSQMRARGIPADQIALELRALSKGLQA